MADTTANLTPVGHRIGPDDRHRRNGHLGGVLWFTGLSGAGKSTLAVRTEEILFAAGAQVTVLDGDNLRHGLSAGLGFTPEGRNENIRRTAEVASLFENAGMIVITSLISPERAQREMAREIVGDRFHEIHIDAPLDVCRARDPKGLYAKADAGKISQFTGVTAPYEAPEAADFVVPTGTESEDACVRLLANYAMKVFGVKAG